MSVNRKIYFAVLFLTLPLLIFGNNGAGKSEATTYKNFSLYDYNNNLHNLKDFTDKKGIVIIFISTKCPISNDYNARMAKLFKEFGNDFSFIGINSNKTEDVKEIKDHAEDNDLKFVILKDKNNIIADQFSASFTPEVYVLDNGYAQLYHGRIDDSRRIDDVEKDDLRNVLNEIKEGKEVSVKETKAFGCTIKRVN